MSKRQLADGHQSHKRKKVETASEAEIDPFDESNFVEKRIDPVKVREEEQGWNLVGLSSVRERKQKELKPDPANLPRSSREYNKELPPDAPRARHDTSHVSYEFGDRGSDWRMMKLRSLREAAHETGREIEDLALERYGNLEKYDEAREEEKELSARKTKGIRKTKPDGSLYQKRLKRDHKHDVQERAHDGEVREEIKADEMSANGQVIEIGDLNSLRAKLLKAQLQNSSDVRHLQDQYDAALHHYNAAANAEKVVVIPGMDTRGEALKKDENDMTIEELVREEKRESRDATQARRDADKIARDSRFKDNLDYQDENAEKLAARIQKKELNLKNISINEFQKMNKILDNCPLCHKNDGEEPPIAPVISLGTRTFLSLPSAPLVKYHCLIVPTQHRSNILECDEDELQEVRNFMKSLTRLFDTVGCRPLFYENNARPYRRSHCAIECIPIPHEMSDNVPKYWEEAILSADEEWAQHRPLIDTKNNQFTRKMSSAMPYFHVWFDLNGGMGHVIEDDKRWPKDDLFGREVVASILGLSVDKWRRKGTWSGDLNSAPEKDFRRVWDRWDWTKALIEQ